MHRQEGQYRAAQLDVPVIGRRFHMVGNKVAREVSRNHFNPQYAGGRRIDPHFAGVARRVAPGAVLYLPVGILVGDLESVFFGGDPAGAGILEVVKLGGRSGLEEIDQEGTELARRHAADILHGPKGPAADGDVAVVFLALLVHYLSRDRGKWRAGARHGLLADVVRQRPGEIQGSAGGLANERVLLNIARRWRSLLPKRQTSC